MKPVSIQITQDGKKQRADFNLPECWEEVPDADFQHLVTLYLKTPEQMDEYDKTVRAFVLLAGAKAWRVLKELEAEELYPLLSHINWVFDKLDIRRNRFPTIKYQKTALSSGHLIGPADGLENIRFAEWVVADGFFVDYAHTDSLESLDNLIAVIYRHQGVGAAFQVNNADYRGDKREKFNDQTVASRLPILKKISLNIKKTIYVWYASCRQQIISQYPDFFPADKTSQDGGEGWFGLYDDLMGDPKFGGSEKLEDTFVHTVFASVNRSQIKMRELKDKYEL